MLRVPRTTRLLALSLVASVSCHARPAPGVTHRSAVVASDPLRGTRGLELFETHCAVCHGVDGGVDGEAASHLFPAPRDLRRGLFHLVTTSNGVPSDADLVATLRRGMPGSSMPSWSWLPDEDLALLASTVRAFAIDGLAQRLHAAALEEGEELALGDARALSAEQYTAAAALAAITDRDVAGADPGLGAELYAANCAACHHEDGTGSREPLWDEEGRLYWPRDFTAGYMKGGATVADLAHRIRAGMPGSPMPATDLSPSELAALAGHVRSMIPPGAESRLVQRRERLLVRRVAGTVPDEHDDERWASAASIDVVLAPLKWRDASVLRASLSALHDGRAIAIRVRWPDETRDEPVLTGPVRSDAVALQMSNADAPPLFGMGAASHPTTIWHWRSRRLEDVAGWMDLLEPSPHLRQDERLDSVRVDVPLYHRLEGVPEVSERVDHLAARGVESARAGEWEASDVRIVPRSAGSGWDVIFVRDLAGVNESDVTFEAGGTLQVACAVWNGAAGDLRAQKSISIWQELALE